MERRIGSIDLLSGLPEEVLCHILSFLPTKTSVCTSVLARRWRSLWTHVPNLEFHDYPLRGNSSTQPLDIINRVIMLHEAKIVNTFSIRFSNVRVFAFPLETLIIYLIKRSVRNLYLESYYKYNDKIVCTLPTLLLTCKTLVDLRLVNCGVIPSSGELFLPSLKKLNLSYVEYEDDESLPHLISRCPVLEELIVNDCFREGQKNLGCVIVSSPTIKTFTVHYDSRSDIENLEEMMIIDVPALVYLKVIFCDLDRAKSLRKTMTSLIEVDITLNGDWHDCEIDCTEHGRSIEFFSCLCHVKYLKMTSEFEEVVIDKVGTGSTVKFVNLTKLQLVLPVKWYNVVKFLEAADNLEVLIISIVETLPFTEPKRVPPCILSRLRTVTLSYFDACEEVYFAVVRYVLRNAQVLERMEIHAYGSTDKENLDTLRRISLFERGSKLCQLDFNTY